MEGRRPLVGLLVTALVLLGVPQVSAVAPACTDEADATIQGYHIKKTDQGDVELWEETNDLDGLQTEACETADGRMVDPDSQAATVPPGIPSVPEIPDPPPITVCIPYTYVCIAPL